jgi:hypothetical protein
MKTRSALFATAGVLVAALSVFSGLGRQTNAADRVPREPRADEKADGDVVVQFRGVIDGSDRLELTQTHAHWTHVNWEWPPEGVSLGGVEWTPAEQGSLPNEGDTKFLPTVVDFRTARLRNVQGRDLVVLEAREDSVVVHLNDTPNGADGAAAAGDADHAPRGGRHRRE